MGLTIGTRQIDVMRVLQDLGVITHGESAAGEIAISCPWPENHKHGSANVNGSVNADSGAWVCYKGCGGGGGSLERLVQQLKDVQPDAARRWLLSRSETIDFSEVEALFESMKSASVEVPSSNHLFKIDYDRMDAKKTSSYILKRGFTPETLHKWGFRYDPTMKAIVIPVYDISGKELVGIVRRMVPPLRSGFPKYLFPEAFKKQSHLFGANQHKSSNGTVILVEGALDAIWLHQHGYTEAVALLGVTCSKIRERLLAQLGQTIVLALDNDTDGLLAMSRLVDQLGKSFTVMYTSIVGGQKDVQELNAEELAEVFGDPHYGWEVD